MARITTTAELRRLYGEPSQIVLDKEIDRLDRHCRTLLSLASYYVIASRGADGYCDATPRGDAVGALHIADDRTLVLPDWPGNRRLDTLTNLLADPAIGLLFVIPGLRETLRINGAAEVRDDEDLRAVFETNGKRPATVIVVHVRQAYIQCGKASIRAGLWDPSTWPDRSAIPPITDVLRDHARLKEDVLTAEDLEGAYRDTLY